MARRPPEPPPGAALRARVVSIEDGASHPHDDLVAAEEPLEVRVVIEEGGRRARHDVAVTMRTPGHDFELAAGFLFAEGAIAGREAVAAIDYCRSGEPEAERNVVEVTLAPGASFDAERLSRNVYTTSSCGVCGKTSLELLRTSCPFPPAQGGSWSWEMLRSLPAALDEGQALFPRTGGLHAAALFDGGGELLLLREDVGRHNALDKLVGARLLAGELPLSGCLVLVSGRASFELVQKAVMAGAPALAAVGAPSSLAVETAEAFGLTLVGFLSERRFNVYAGAEKVVP